MSSRVCIYTAPFNDRLTAIKKHLEALRGKEKETSSILTIPHLLLSRLRSSS